MSVTTSPDTDLGVEVKNLEDKLANLKRSIMESVGEMDKSKEARDVRRKDCVLKVMKMVLANLEAQDKEVMREMKSEAFDLLRVCSQSEAELSKLSSAISSGQGECSQLLTELRDLDRHLDGVGIQTFVQSVNLSVDLDSFDSGSLMEIMRDAVFLKTPSASPRSFKLVIPETGSPESDILKLEVHIKQDGLSFNPSLLRRLVFSVGFTDLENSSLWAKLVKSTGEISANGKIFTFRMRKRRNMNCKISVKYLSSNISSSPQLLEAVKVVKSDLLKTPSQASEGKLAHNLSDDSCTGQNPPQKIPRLEEECVKPISEEAPVQTPPSEVATANIWDKSVIQHGEGNNDTTVPLELDCGEEEMEEDEEMVTSSPSADQDSTPTTAPISLWKTLTSNPSATWFDFLQDLEEVGSYGAINVGNRSRSEMALINPNDVTYVPLQHCFLVSEPTLYRIGVYEAETFSFVRWLTHPENGDRSFNMPMSLLSLSNGDVLILEKDRIWIFDSNLRGLQKKYGSFSGLAEGCAGEVFTLAHLREGGVFSVQKLVAGPERYYLFDGQIQLDVIETFSDRKISKPRFITYSNNKLFITDIGINKFYVVDLLTGSQKAFGYFGSNDVQLHKPAGILSDDHGHLLIADRNNRRLLVFSETGEFIKVAKKETLRNNKLVLVQSVRRFRNFLLVVQMARRENPMCGRVVCYKLNEGRR